MLNQEGVDGYRLVAPLVDEVPANTSHAGLGANLTRDQAVDPH